MKKINLLAVAGVVTAIAAFSIIAAQASTSPLAVTCSSSVNNNVVTWSATTTGGNAPYSFVWSGATTAAVSTSTSITNTYAVNGTYTAWIQATDASTTVATSSCQAAVTSNVVATSTPTSTPPLPRVNPPTLNIGPNGSFFAHGAIVTSVASGSIQVQIWGITYTVNFTGFSSPEFFLRKGNRPTSTVDIFTQLQVGDEVGIAGMITSSSPMTVNGTVIRDYSISTSRPGKREGQSDSPFYNGVGNGNNGDGSHEGQNGQGGASSSVSGTMNLQLRLQNLLDELHGLEGNGNGKPKGNN